MNTFSCLSVFLVHLNKNAAFKQKGSTPKNKGKFCQANIYCSSVNTCHVYTMSVIPFSFCQTFTSDTHCSHLMWNRCLCLLDLSLDSDMLLNERCIDSPVFCLPLLSPTVDVYERSL